MSYGQRQIGRGESGEQQVEVNDLMAIQGHVWVHGPVAAMVCVSVLGS